MTFNFRIIFYFDCHKVYFEEKNDILWGKKLNYIESYNHSPHHELQWLQILGKSHNINNMLNLG